MHLVTLVRFLQLQQVPRPIHWLIRYIVSYSKDMSAIWDHNILIPRQ